ncbi:alpha/beta hydrolase [Amycolatopsis decaplanina]|uniref:Alpha/beta hydrolase fold-3 domain-containing protein n=1 Tax=Amycolatopsis decaplanina DSM 44594 TaxID=1284240 RepID=M2YND3_9PSEU|nr:alpha/beta hydrolase [Amycolatopsis decaplanina]EME63425.1 alpha/beta hydrolase fold-3 domain-containing protein [Amycolatopsis decaplanina DSM 44594]
MTAFDPELAGALEGLPSGPPLGADSLAGIRQAMAAGNLTCAEAIGDRDLVWEDRQVPGTDVVVTVVKPRDAEDAPGLYNIHGGGMVLDNRFADLPRMVALVEEFGFVAVTVDYRLAPEHPHPAPIEDCYAGLTWMVEHAAELGFDPGRLIVGGGSAGGGLSAGIALLARDRGGPALAGQLLLCPMIDSRNDSASTVEFAERGVWGREANEFGWRSLLNGQTSPYAVPATAADLTGLPPAFIEVGAAEIFRDEDVDYARRLWQAGVPTELHVWAGAYHGFDRIAPDSEVTRAALAARASWLRRTIGRA